MLKEELDQVHWQHIIEESDKCNTNAAYNKFFNILLFSTV